ncbi:MAG: NAD(P)-binding protein, partial [Rhodobacterales bacterium]|nr:NAD(P)-binding protein [Rhodobacterales bacterium]
MRRAVVIGAGHNGLVAACVLATKGWEVEVIEQGERAGGLARRETFATGFQHTGLLRNNGGIRPSLLADLGLSNLASTAPPLTWGEDAEGRVIGLGTHGQDHQLAEEQQWAGFLDFIESYRPLYDQMRSRPAPAPLGGLSLDLVTALWHTRAIGEQALTSLIRTIPQSSEAWLQANVPNPAVRAMVAAQGLRGGWHSPFEPTSA